MKNLLLVVCSLVLTCCFQSLQAQVAKPGAIDISVGVGLLPTFNKDDGDVKLLPLTIGADYQFSQHFSLGLLYGHSITEAEEVFLDADPVKWSNSFSTVGLRVIVNGGKWEKWDVYGGFSLNYNSSVITILEGNNPSVIETVGLESETTFSYTGFIGANYAIDKKWAVFGELGYSVSIASVGVKYQIK
ncbi:MAG: outer membrane beta-barrel protein [Bacteroidota bacterium]